jgi:hypothetical protein
MAENDNFFQRREALAVFFEKAGRIKEQVRAPRYFKLAASLKRKRRERRAPALFQPCSALAPLQMQQLYSPSDFIL